MRRKMYGRALWRLVALVVLMGFPAARGEPLLFVNDFDGFVAAAGGAVTTIDFETLPDGSETFSGMPITPEVNYTPLGVTFSSPYPELFIGFGPPGVRFLQASNFDSQARNWIIAEFDPPLRAVGVLTLPFTELSAFNEGNGLIGSLAHGLDPGRVFLGIVSESPIYRVIGDAGSENAFFDDLYFAPVPEPATFLLLAGGCVALIRRRR